MKLVSESLGVSRSQLTARIKQAPEQPKPRRRRTIDDAALVEWIRGTVSDLPSYGYRRVMRDHGLLLERRRKQPGITRRHDGRVAVETSNSRWCSDGFEFRCDDGERLRVTFALDCCDREAISWVASLHGHSGDDVRDVMLEAVERRFGQTLPAAPIQWLSGIRSINEARPWAVSRAFLWLFIRLPAVGQMSRQPQLPIRTVG